MGKDVFKSYKKQIKFKNDKLQSIPSLAERIRIVFYFRKQYKMPPIIANADTIAEFINMATTYTDNRELKQNWYACLDVTQTREEAASLFAHYGWAATYDKEFPKTENAFFTVKVQNGARHYNIIESDITLRFAAIEQMGRGVEAYNIITSKKLSYERKRNKLQELFQPFLWWYNDIRMGLTEDARQLCNKRITDYIDNLLFKDIADGTISIDEHIRSAEIDKSETGINWAKPQQFIVSIDDMEFVDYTYNINAEYNRANNADKGMKRAYEKYSRLQGDEWYTPELKSQGYTPQQVINYCRYSWIEEVPEKKKGNLKCYRRILR